MSAADKVKLDAVVSHLRLSWLQDAVAKCGFTNPVDYFRDFLENLGDTDDSSLPATVTFDASPGGVLNLQTNTTANRAANWILGYGVSTTLAPFPVGATKGFYLAMRCKLGTAVNAETEVGMWGSRSAAGPVLGVKGSVSTAKFSASGFQNGGNLISTVNVDTNWHTMILYRPEGGSLTYFAVDGETPVSANSYQTLFPTPIVLTAQNGPTTAANRQLLVDAITCVTERHSG